MYILVLVTDLRTITLDFANCKLPVEKFYLPAEKSGKLEKQSMKLEALLR